MGSWGWRMGGGALAPAAATLWLACGDDYTAAPVPDEPIFVEDEAAAAPRDSAPLELGDAADASKAPTFCDASTPFQTFTTLPGNVNTASEDAFPTLTDDELTLYFQRSPAGGGNPTFFVAQRATTMADFTNPVPVSELADGRLNSTPTVTPKGDALYFGSDSDIRMAKSVGVGRFGVAMPVPGLSGAESENAPALFGSGDELWLSIFVDGGLHLRRSALSSDGGFGAPERITELESASYESGAASTRDGLTVYFGSARPGGSGAGDIWVARRASRTAPFSDISPLAEVNSTFEEAPGWLSADACRLYFTTTRLGTYDIYLATRPKP